MAGPVNASLIDITVWRHPETHPEHPGEMVGAEICLAGEVIQHQRLVKMRFDVVDYPAAGRCR